MWTLLKIFAFAVLCYATITAWVYSSQRNLLYFPSGNIGATPAEIGLQYDEVWLINAYGTSIHAWWLPHDNARFTVLFSHGNGGNNSHRLETFRILHALGLSVMIYDYSGYGRSGSEPSEKATQADTQAAWDWLTEEKGIAPESIILFGRSLGGAVSASLADDLSKAGVSPAGIVLESTFTSVPDMGARIYPWLPVRLLTRDRYDSMGALSDVRLPALFSHSPDDEIIPYELGRRLYDAYAGPKTFCELAGDHNNGYLLMGNMYVNCWRTFLNTLEQRVD